MPDYQLIADEIRFSDEQPDKEWWKDQGRETVAKAVQTLVEVHEVPVDEAKDILSEVFWTAMAECGQ